MFKIRNRKTLTVTLSIFLISLTVVSALWALGLGSVDISAHDVINVVARRLNLIAGDDVTLIADRIVWQLRMPRILASLAVGTCLSVCGVILQSLTRNDLADPYLLGISSGASVGAVAVIVFGMSLPFVPDNLVLTTASFAGALTALVLVLVIATGRSGSLPAGRTILAGVAIAQLCSAATSLMILVFGSRTAGSSVLSWTMGSFAGIRWSGSIAIMVVTFLGLIGVSLVANILDAFAFGEVSARSLGINVERARWVLLTITALVTSVTVSFVGPIGFVGLTMPHLIRIAVGPVHRVLLPLSALAGACFLLLCDTASRSIAGSSEIPIGVITGFIGTPLLIILVRRQARKA